MRRDWSKSLGLELTVGDVITDVKLVCSSQCTINTLNTDPVYERMLLPTSDYCTETTV